MFGPPQAPPAATGEGEGDVAAVWKQSSLKGPKVLKSCFCRDFGCANWPCSPRERRIQRERKNEKVRDKEGEKVAVGYPVFGTNDITIRIQTQHIKQPRTPCPIMPARPEAMPALGQAGSDSQSNAAAGVNSELGFGNRSRILSITASPGADRAPPYQLVVVGRIDMIMHATAAMPTWPLQLPWGSSHRLLCGGFGSLDDVGLGLKLVVALPFCKSVRTYANFRGLE